MFHVSRSLELISAFDRAVTSSMLYRLVLLGKGLQQRVSVRVQAGWGVMAPAPRKAQWHTVCSAPSAEVSVGKDCRGSSMAMAAGACSDSKGSFR